MYWVHNVTMKVNIKIGNPVKSSAGARRVSPGLHPVSPVSPDGSALVHIGPPRSARIQCPHPGIPCLCLACPAANAPVVLYFVLKCIGYTKI